MANLFVILARGARTGVIFRRGPSRQVLLIKWNLRNDSFEIGQWLKGRLFERRCDLSPSGKLLAYFAAKYNELPYCWTVVSRPPYLTALALWPKPFGVAGGGGLFNDERTLLVNHENGEFKLAEGFRIGNRLDVHPFGKHSGRGGDEAIYHTRLLRDGWSLKQRERQVGDRDREPRIYERPTSRREQKRLLRMLVRGEAEQQGYRYLVDYEVLDESGAKLLKLPRTNWADWDHNGDLLFVDGGKVFRLRWTNRTRLLRENASELADFSALTFTAKEAPKKALNWDTRS